MPWFPVEAKYLSLLHSPNLPWGPPSTHLFNGLQGIFTQGMKLTTHLYLVLRFTLNATALPILHTPSWHVMGQTYLCFTSILLLLPSPWTQISSFSTTFLTTLRLCSSFNVRDQVSHPQKTTAKIIVLNFLIIVLLYSKQEHKIK